MTIDEIHPGDHVIVRDWEDMADEFGTDYDGDQVVIDFGSLAFVKPMKNLCGKEFMVDEIDEERSELTLMPVDGSFKKEDIDYWIFAPEMLRHVEPAIEIDVNTNDFFALLS